MNELIRHGPRQRSGVTLDDRRGRPHLVLVVSRSHRARVRASRSRRRRRIDVAAGMTLIGLIMTGGAAATYALAIWAGS